MCKQNTTIIWVHVQSPLVTVHTITMSTMTAFHISIDSYYDYVKKIPLHTNTACLTRQHALNSYAKRNSNNTHLTHDDSTVHVELLRALCHAVERRQMSPHVKLYIDSPDNK